MPLAKGSTPEVISANIAELIKAGLILVILIILNLLGRL